MLSVALFSSVENIKKLLFTASFGRALNYLSLSSSHSDFSSPFPCFLGPLLPSSQWHQRPRSHQAVQTQSTSTPGAPRAAREACSHQPLLPWRRAGPPPAFPEGLTGGPFLKEGVSEPEAFTVRLCFFVKNDCEQTGCERPFLIQYYLSGKHVPQSLRL